MKMKTEPPTGIIVKKNQQSNNHPEDFKNHKHNRDLINISILIMYTKNYYDFLKKFKKNKIIIKN